MRNEDPPNVWTIKIAAAKEYTRPPVRLIRRFNPSLYLQVLVLPRSFGALLLR